MGRLLSMLVLFSLSATDVTPKGNTGMLEGVYYYPLDAKHTALYQRLKKAHLLERLTGAAASLRLPKPLMLRFASCGVANAWYDPANATVTFCYEYAAELEQVANRSVEQGLDPNEAFEGSVIFILLHETSHAVFDLLHVPILGREEDAADQVSAFFLLRSGQRVARRVLSGAAWMYLIESRSRKPDDSDFGDAHALDAQRFYNVLCLAYGGNQKAFATLIKKKYLTNVRETGCADEFKQVAWAVMKLIDPSVDAELAARIKAARRQQWEEVQTAADAVQAAAEAQPFTGPQ